MKEKKTEKRKLESVMEIDLEMMTSVCIVVLRRSRHTLYTEVV